MAEAIFNLFERCLYSKVISSIIKIKTTTEPSGFFLKISYFDDV